MNKKTKATVSFLVKWGLIALMIFSLIMSARAAGCGDGVCEGRTSWSDPDGGLGSENWDNCPADCARTFNERPTWVTYHTSLEIETIMDDLIAKYPSLIRKEKIGESIEGRPIMLYVVGEGKGGFFFDGRLHGVEDCGTEAGLQFVRWTLMSKDSKAKDIRDNGGLLFLPILNPDSTGRQNNRRSYPDGTIVTYGVDLNRNFPAGWGTTGSSNPFDAYEYRGLYAASEPETQAMIKVLDDYDPRVYFNVHCGQAVASGGGNTSTSSLMVSIMRNESNRLDNALFAQLSPHYSSGCGSGGYAKAEACDSNTSSWLVEVAPWDQVPATLEAYNDKYWHNLWPLYYSGALAARLLITTSLPSPPEPPQDPQTPDEKPIDQDPAIDSPQGGDSPSVLNKLEASAPVSKEALTSGSDKDILILNIILPLKEIAPWIGLVLFLSFVGGVFVMFKYMGDHR